MPTVNVSIRGNIYQVACDAGQEAHLEQIASTLNKRLNLLASTLGTASDSMLLVMTALMMEDELTELKKLRGPSAAEYSHQTEEWIADTFNSLAEYIETIAKKLENP